MKYAVFVFAISLFSLDAQGRCIGEDVRYQDYCAQFPVKEACEPRQGVCRWIERNVLGSLPGAITVSLPENQ